MPYAKKRSAPKRFYRKKSKATVRKTRRAAPKSNFQRSRVAALPRPASQVQRGSAIFPASYFARLKYAENSFITASGTTGTSAIGFKYSTNNTFDPRFSLGGTQPLEYAEMSAVYLRAFDHSCKVTLEFTNPTHDGMYVGYRIRHAGNTVTTENQSIDYLQTLQWTKFAAINNTGSQTKTFTVYVPNHQVFGVTKTQYQNLEYSHLTSANPSDYAWIEPFAYHTIAGENATVRYNIKMTYYTQFTNRVSSAQS